jgi:hypothetical protein
MTRFTLCYKQLECGRSIHVLKKENYQQTTFTHVLDEKDNDDDK